MRKIILLILGFLFTTSIYYCQDRNEFNVYSNGLIYSEQTMSKLSLIVDSLNLQFKTCDFDKVFYSHKQTVGYIVSIEKENVIEAKKDMENNISLEDFRKKYQDASIKENILFILRKSENYEDQEILVFKNFDIEKQFGVSIISNDMTLYEKDLAGKWVLEYFEKSEDYDKSLRGFYFPTNFKSIPIPQKYSQMIGYSDCLIDTTTTKLKETQSYDWVDLPDNWTSLSDTEKVKLLDDLRSTKVYGFCSADHRPRKHAINIAMLSAETYNWGVFLKAHLDIMNDRFSRMTDGSYALKERHTYIRELEELNINVSDLLLGITFDINNPAENHYFANVRRIGRALSETQNREKIEEEILSIISDEKLDIFNRIVFYYLFLNYNHHIEDEGIKEENKNKLEIAEKTFSDILKMN